MTICRFFLLIAATLCGLPVSILRANNHEALIEGAKKEGKLVVYTSMTVDQAQRLNDAFKAKYPFIQPSMFRAVGERLLTRIMTEAQAGKYDFDVVQSAETQAYFLKKKNLLAKYVAPETKNVQRPFFDPDGYWAAVYMMPNVVGYNTRMIKGNEVPRSDEDLLNPKWKGKIGMDHTKPEWFSWKLKRMGEEKGVAYMKKLGAQEFKLYSGLTILTSLLAAGEFPLVLNTYVHNVEEFRRKRRPGGLDRPGSGLYQISAHRRRLQGGASQRSQALCRFHVVRGRTKDHRLLRSRADAARRADHGPRHRQIELCHRRHRRGR